MSDIIEETIERLESVNTIKHDNGKLLVIQIDVRKLLNIKSIRTFTIDAKNKGSKESS